MRRRRRAGCASRCARWRASSPATACCSAARRMSAAPSAKRVDATRLALRGDLLDFIADPAWGDVDSRGGALAPRPLAADRRRPHRRRRRPRRPTRAGSAKTIAAGWILPGFIDTHVHSPQLDVIASYGTELLDWLTTYTFPAEARYADAVARRSDRGAVPRCAAGARHDRGGGVPDGAQGLGRRAVRRGRRRAACASSPARC